MSIPAHMFTSTLRCFSDCTHAPWTGTPYPAAGVHCGKARLDLRFLYRLSSQCLKSREFLATRRWVGKMCKCERERAGHSKTGCWSFTRHRATTKNDASDRMSERGVAGALTFFSSSSTVESSSTQGRARVRIGMRDRGYEQPGFTVNGSTTMCACKFSRQTCGVLLSDYGRIFLSELCNGSARGMPNMRSSEERPREASRRLRVTPRSATAPHREGRSVVE